MDGMAIFIDLKLEMSPGFYNYLISDDYKKREKLFLEKIQSILLVHLFFLTRTVVN